jgi:O-Antigen ligase
MGGDLPEVVAAQIIFATLLPLVLFAPARWAIVAWLVMGNLDTTGPGQSATAVVGWLNAVKGLILPIYLCYRLRSVPTEIPSTVPARLWLLLTSYAIIAGFWAPFPLAAAKLVGNMIGVFLTLIVLEKSARKGLLTARCLVFLISTSLLLGAVQTYYYGGASFGFDGVDQPSRFSSFVAAQQYAPFLVAFLTVVLWDRRLSAILRFGLCAALCTAIALNGSRTWFLGAFLVVLVYGLLSFRRVVAFVAFGAATAALCALLISAFDPFETDFLEDTSNRIVATVNAVFSGQDNARNAGLRNVNFRLAIYDGVLGDMRAGSTGQILFGHGTSSGGNAVLRVFPASYKIERLDPNRTIHNEWLRALYEWGIVGLGLLLGVFGTLLYGLIIRYRDPHWKIGCSAVLSFVPAFLVGLSTENLLAGAGNAVTMSLALAVAILWTPSLGGQRPVPRQLAHL